MAESFKKTFPGFVPGAETNEIINLISVERMILKNADRTIVVYVSSHRPIHKKLITALERELLIFLRDTGLKKVKLIENFQLSAQYTPQAFLAEYSDSMCYELRYRDTLAMNLFRNMKLEKVEEQKLCFVIGASSVALTAKIPDLIRYLEAVFNERCGFGITCECRIDSAKQKKVFASESDAAMREISERLSKKEQSQEGSAKETSAKNKKEKDPDIIFGQRIEEDSTPICEIEEDSGYVTIYGKVIFTDFRELKKSGKFLFIFSVTDETDTINGKMFLTPEQKDEIAPRVKVKMFVKVRGRVSLDTFDNETNISPVVSINEAPKFSLRSSDHAPEKRCELHCHTKMSVMDGVSDAGTLVDRAYEMGHPAIAITDHGVVQSFPIANKAYGKLAGAYKKKYQSEHPEATKEELEAVQFPFKVIYGCEIYLVDDMVEIVRSPKGQTIDDDFVVFDLETTGLSCLTCRIIEIGAVRISGGKIVKRYSTFVDPQVPVPLKVETLTGINDSMLVGKRTIKEVLPEFLEFCKGAVLVAHNADFDTSFIKKACEDQGLPYDFTVMDTVAMARFLIPNLTRFKLDTVAKHLGVSLENHHRAVDDAECTAEIFLKLSDMCREKGMTRLEYMNEQAHLSEEAIRHMPYYHAVVLVKNETGRVNLYRMISESHLKYFYRRPKMPRSLIEQYKEGLIIGSACAAGELVSAILKNAGDDELSRIVSFYDYLEVQPLCNNGFLLRDEGYDWINTEEDLQKINQKILHLGEQFGKPVVATGDVHFCDKEDGILRKIILKGQNFEDADDQPPLYLRTTEEMLTEFSYLDDKKAKEIVIDNPAKIAAQCEVISPIRKGKFPPVIENSDRDLKDMCYENAHALYGPELPPIVEARLERELTSIISNGYAVMYIIAQKLVSKSNEDGYLVGSRGSVGSSFVATMSGITEVNPLPPHYLCANCHYVDFDSEEVKSYTGRCGVDMPDKLCPDCGQPLQKLGFDIPFETFLGFKGNKEPDIDLNFSGEYQSNAHKYTEVIFGKGQTFRAGTIGTLGENTAFGYVKNYYLEEKQVKRNCEISRIVQKMTGIGRTTGQHPGGIIVLPHGEDINSFTPIQHPANDMSSDIITTHFEYHSIDENLLKLDILGHDDPTMIRMLEDITGTNAKEIPLDDPDVMTLFKGTQALGISPADIGGCKLGCLGVPEFGTDFVIQMLLDTNPSSLSDLIRISGLSHGTDVWIGNAKTLVQEGKATISTAICTRDDIMIYLISKGVESETSFTIMESVRKGRGLRPEWEETMREHDVPEWYIWSCKKIKYMFPKAHAAAYVMMAYRIAWYKINYPAAYYAAYFSIRASAFSYDIMCRGKEHLNLMIEDYQARYSTLSKKEQDTFKDMKIVREMYARGLEFLPLDIYRSTAHRFLIIDGKLLPSLDSIEGMGEIAAEAVEEEAKKGAFLSVDDFRTRTKVSKTIIAVLENDGILKGLPQSNQFSLF